MDGERNNLRLIRIAMILVMAAAAVVITIQLKATNRDDNKDNEPKRRKIRMIALAVGFVMIVGIMGMTVLINQKKDETDKISDLTISTDLATGAVSGEETEEADTSDKFVYAIGKGNNAKNVTVSFPEEQSGFGLWRTVYYVALALLLVLVFGLLYYFRYERDLGFPIVNTIILILLMMITLYPVLNTVAYSFNDGTDAARAGIGIWPRQFSVDSYKQILTPTIYRAAGVSAAKTIITTRI